MSEDNCDNVINKKYGIGENICKLYFETIFNKPFLKIRPKWLLNENGNRLELDGYNDELKIAFEYNGECHYTDFSKQYPQFIDLITRQRWDQQKIETCKSLNIKLIVIPQLFTRLPLKELKGFLKVEFLKQDIKLPLNYDLLIINLDNLPKNAAFYDLKSIAVLNGGRCLSKNYIASNVKLKWECSKLHIWEATPSHIKSGGWCKICSYEERILSLKEVVEIIKNKGGELLSTNYTNTRQKLEIKCLQCQYIWYPKLNKINSGQWCPNCAGKIKFTINDVYNFAAENNMKCTSNNYINCHEDLEWLCENGHFFTKCFSYVKRRGLSCKQCYINNNFHIAQELAIENNGECLSDKFISSKEKLKWKCYKNHTWETTLNNIYNTWCPHCAKNKKLTIEDAKWAAELNNGFCLSDIYVNSTSKLLWRCNNLHEWQTSLKSIRNGSWCPTCYNNNNALSINEASELAIKNNGQCISTKYINSYTKLKWRCKRNHIWEAPLYSIKRGTWCKRCFNEFDSHKPKKEKRNAL